MPSDEEEIVSLGATPAGVTETSIRGAVVSLNFLTTPDAEQPDTDVPPES